MFLECALGLMLTVAAAGQTDVAPSDARSLPAATQSTIDPQLATLRRSAERMDDLPQIISRYQKFIAQADDPAVAEMARQDLAIWQDRRDRKLVKSGDKWVSAIDRSELKQDATLIADQARQLIRDSKYKDAEALLAKAMERDAANVSALYLRGVVYFRTNQLGLSRRNFELVRSILKDDPAILNNLATILWKQNQFPASLNAFDQAMTASPQNKAILDNVSAALANLPDREKNSLIAKRVRQKFADQDARLSERMSSQGMFRSGNGWITQSQLDQKKQAEAEVQNKLADLAQEYDAATARLSAIDNQMNANARDMQMLQYPSAMNAGPQRPLSSPLNANELAAQNEKLRSERILIVARMQNLKMTAANIQKAVGQVQLTPGPDIIGVEGTPVVIPPAPTLAESTSP